MKESIPTSIIILYSFEFAAIQTVPKPGNIAFFSFLSSSHFLKHPNQYRSLEL